MLLAQNESYGTLDLYFGILYTLSGNPNHTTNKRIPQKVLFVEEYV
jgi:hypothetical protein